MPTAIASSPAYRWTKPGILPLPNSTLTRFSKVRMSCIRSYIHNNFSLLMSIRFPSLARRLSEKLARLHSMKSEKGKQNEEKKRERAVGCFSSRRTIPLLAADVPCHDGKRQNSDNSAEPHNDIVYRAHDYSSSKLVRSLWIHL